MRPLSLEQQRTAIELLKDAAFVIDILFAMRIQRGGAVRKYYPSRSGKPWDTLKAINQFNKQMDAKHLHQ